MPTLLFKGTSVPLVPFDKLTPGEMSAIERVTGYTQAKIQWLKSGCVCDHPDMRHIHRDAAGEVVDDDLSCLEDGCRCKEFNADEPFVINSAIAWISIKRAMPDVKFSDVQDTEGDQFDLLADQDGGPDPTDPPESGAESTS